MIKNINLLYAQINQADIEILVVILLTQQNHKQVYNKKIFDTCTHIDSLSHHIKTIKQHMYQNNMEQGFAMKDLENDSPGSVYRLNDVPFTFCSILKDYPLLNVFKE